MKKLLTFFVALSFITSGLAQTELPFSKPTGDTPIFGSGLKAPGDSCGFIFNDRIGLAKTTTIFTEYLSDQDNAAHPLYASTYLGRAQRFSCPQPIEVGGVKFYGYFNNPAFDSIRVFVYLWDYDDGAGEPGTLLATDTAWVTTTAYTAVLPDVEVIGLFDTPVTVTEEYCVGMIADTTGGMDDSVFIYRSANPDGAGEGLAYAMYQNEDFPGFNGWYDFADFGGVGGGYDIDYLIAPYIKFDLHDSFTIADDTICPEVVSAGCVDYTQIPAFADPQYNGSAFSPTDYLTILWGDGFQNTGLTTACHTYDNPGTFSINLIDTLLFYNFNTPYCVVDISQDIYVLDLPTASFTYSSTGMTVDFSNTSTGTVDSVNWDFDDGGATSNLNDPTHSFGSIDTFYVTMIAYNECGSDTIVDTIYTTDVGIYDDFDDFVIYPNPANLSLVVDGVPAGSDLTLMNLVGQVVHRQTTIETKEILDVSMLPNGAYFVKILSDGKQITKKIIVKH